MKKTVFQRSVALLLCLIFATGCFSLNSLAADGAATNANKTGNSAGGLNSSVYDTSGVLEALSSIPYKEYMAEHADVGSPSDENTKVVIDVWKDLCVEKSDAEYRKPTQAELDENPGLGDMECIVTPEIGSVSWTVPEGTEKAKYMITINYYAIDDGKSNAVERTFRINNKVPFSEARYLTIKKNWANDYVDAIYSGKDMDAVKSQADELGLNYTESEGKLYIEYPRVWTSAVTNFCNKYSIRFFKIDIHGNELRPTAEQTPSWETYTLADSSGYFTEAFEFVVGAGDVITLQGKNANLAVSEIILTPAEKLVSYEEYKDYYINQMGYEPGEGTVTIQGEYIEAASDKTIYALEDAADAMTFPHDASKTLLNVMGGEKWQTAGQWVTYTFKVDKSGMYDIVTRFRQNVLDGMFVNRALYIYTEGIPEGSDGYYDGAPFKEAKALTYNYSDKWQVTQATDGKQEFSFYFDENATYTIKFEVTLGDMGEVIETVQNSLNSINDDYLAIIQLTGATPDSYRDYGFSRIMPEVLIDMVIQGRVLNNDDLTKGELGVAQKLTELAGQKSSSVGTLQKVSDLLIKMGRDEDSIASSLDRLKSYIGTLGTFLSSAKTQPLEIDYIMIQPMGEEEPAAEANIFQTLFHEISRFFWSFFRDYDSVGATKETTEDSLEVWLATGRDQAQVKRNLVNNVFTEMTKAQGKEITVELKLVAGGTLLPSILAKKGPDVYHGLAQGDVINYAIRSAILPMYSEKEEYYDGNSENGEILIDRKDFEDTTDILITDPSDPRYGDKVFNDAAMIVLGMEDADGDMNYYGLPEAQGFSMMFVRVDILAEIGLDIPRTWDDIMAAVPHLQAKNMEIGITADTNIHLYQMGGELFADDGMRINLDSKVGLTAFTKMCEFFTKYGFPYTYDAANRFRTGEMPILIGDYTGLYNQLKVFATEIEGLWTMVPVPGTVQLDEDGEPLLDEDGNEIVNNCAVSSVNASVIVSGADEKGKYQDAWTYIKWFTGQECQESYGNEMVAIMGPSAKYNTANRFALANIPWTAEERIMIEAQFNNLASIPNYPGSYIIGRYTDFAFMAAYNEGADPTQSLHSYIHTINKEITRKRTEFGLETLAAGETLASKRLGQASAAIAEFKGRSNYDQTLADEVTAAISSKDIVILEGVANSIMSKFTSDELKSLSSSVKIARGPDITDEKVIDNNELIYYIAVALKDAAKALASY